jgi:hypothetical protein
MVHALLGAVHAALAAAQEMPIKAHKQNSRSSLTLAFGVCNGLSVHPGRSSQSQYREWIHFPGPGVRNDGGY